MSWDDDDDSGVDLLDHEHHHGKCAVAVEVDKVTITIECVTCGRIVLGPMNVRHLGSLGTILTSITQKLGIDPGGAEILQHMTGDKDIISEGMAKFEQIPMDPSAAKDWDIAHPKPGLWNWLKEKIH